MSAPAVASSLGVGWTERLGAYVALTKPRIIELLLITTVPSMVLAARGWPGTWLVVATLIGGTLSAGGAEDCAPAPAEPRTSAASANTNRIRLWDKRILATRTTSPKLPANLKAALRVAGHRARGGARCVFLWLKTMRCCSTA